MIHTDVMIYAWKNVINRFLWIYIPHGKSASVGIAELGRMLFVFLKDTAKIRESSFR